MDHLPNTIAHFAINADDVGASQAFYSQCFGWGYEPYGPPEFFRIVTSTGDRPGAMGALQRRRDLGDARITGFECTVAVDDVDSVVAAATRAGGRVLMDRTTLMGVGHLVWLADPSGNVVGAMQYDSTAQ